MSDYTAQELLEAVGVTPDAEPGWLKSRLFTIFGTEYIGPEVGTPELDAILIVEGQRWLVSFAEVNNNCWDVLFRVRKNAPKQFDLTNDWAAVYLIAICPTPGHALARAIKEVKK